MPTVGDFLSGFEAISWFGIGVPQGASTEIIRRLNTEINAGLADLKLKARLAELGGTPLPGTPADFGKLIAEETETWAKVIKSLALRRTEAGKARIFHKSRSAKK